MGRQEAEKSFPISSETKRQHHKHYEVELYDYEQSPVYAVYSVNTEKTAQHRSAIPRNRYRLELATLWGWFALSFS